MTHERDLHRERAAEIFGVTYEQVTDAQRRVGKAANFGDNYAGGERMKLKAVMDYLAAESRPRACKTLLFGLRYGRPGPLQEPTKAEWDLSSIPSVAINVDFSLVEKRILDSLSLPRPAYRPGTTLPQIIEDGWSRGFHPSQTLCEARGMGFVVSEEWIIAHWDRMNKVYELNIPVPVQWHYPPSNPFFNPYNNWMK